jgi:chemotaxis protein MotB
LAYRRRNQRAVNIWPGFVDALSTLLLVVIFVLLVFTVSQYVLSLALSGSEEKLQERDQALLQLSSDFEDVSREQRELRANVAGLSSEVSARLKEISKLKANLADAEKEKDRLSQKIETVSLERQQLQASEKVLVEKRNSLLSDLRVLTRERDGFAEQTDSLTSERNSLIERLTAIVGEQKKTATDLKLKEQELQKTLALADDLESQLASEADRLSVLRARFATLTEEKERTTQELLSEKDSLVKIRAQLASLTQDKTRTEANLSAERAILADLRTEFDSLGAQQQQTAQLLALTEEERLALEEKSKALLNDVAELQSIKGAMLQSAETLQTDLESMTTARNLLQARIEDLQQEYAGFRENSEEQRDDLRTEVATTQEQLDRMRAKSDELDKEVRLLLAARQALEASGAELSSTNDQLMSVTGQLTDEKLEALDKIEALALLVSELQTDNAKVNAELEDAFKSIDVDRAKLEATLAEVAILRNLREDFLKQVKTLQGALQSSQGDGGQLASQLQDARASEEAQSIVLQEAQAKVDILNSQIFNLRQQITALNEALNISESTTVNKELEIAQLSSRLNVALASKVQELARYKSEFFGRLRDVVANRDDVKIVGDRFVFQSELLFESGSDRLGSSGRDEMEKFANMIIGLASKLPDDIDWILRVDGHTDAVPLSGNGRFRSNWDLSAARALSVVDFLVEQGLPPKRLAATGFGEHQPIIPGISPEANSQNRRIEFKLTER